MATFALVDKQGYFFAGNERPMLPTWPASPFYSLVPSVTFATRQAAEDAHSSICRSHYQNFRIVELDETLSIINDTV